MDGWMDGYRPNQGRWEHENQTSCRSQVTYNLLLKHKRRPSVDQRRRRAGSYSRESREYNGFGRILGRNCVVTGQAPRNNIGSTSSVVIDSRCDFISQIDRRQRVLRGTRCAADSPARYLD